LDTTGRNEINTEREHQLSGQSSDQIDKVGGSGVNSITGPISRQINLNQIHSQEESNPLN